MLIFAIKKMKRSILFASMGIAAGLVLANIYTSLVDVPAWGSNIPASLETTRQYYKVSNPGNFFRIFSPLNQGLGLLCVLLFWKQGKAVRRLVVAAFLLYIIGEAMTFEYFYPRNDIMFKSDLADVEHLKNTLQEWRSMNWVRSLVIATGVVCSALALHRSYAIVGSISKINRTSAAGAIAVSVQ
jgi:hypothetical protein